MLVIFETCLDSFKQILCEIGMWARWETGGKILK